MRRSATAAVAASLIALSVAACGGGSPSGGGSSGDYVIGYVNGMSGALAVYGQYTLSYLQAAVKAANAGGGVNGRKVDIEVVDSAAAGQNSVSATQQLIAQHHPDVLYGLTLSQDCKAVAPVAAKNKIPLVCGSGDASLLQPVQPYEFASFAIEPALAKPSLDFATQDLKLGPGTTYAVLTGAAGGSSAYGTSVDALAKSAGFKRVAYSVIPTGAASGATEVSDVLAAKPDVIFADAASQVTELVQALRAARLNTPVISVYTSLGYTGFMQLAYPGLYEVMQSSFVTSQTAAASSGVAQIKRTLEAAGMTSPTAQNQILGPQVILPALGILQALTSCGRSCPPQDMATALDKVKINLDGFATGYGWSAASHMPITSVTVISYDPSAKQPKTDAVGLPVGAVSP